MGSPRVRGASLLFKVTARDDSDRLGLIRAVMGSHRVRVASLFFKVTARDDSD